MKFYLIYLSKIFQISSLGKKFYIIALLSIISSIFDVLSLGLVIPIVSIIFENSLNNFSNNLLFSLDYINTINGKKNILILFGIFFFLKTIITILIYRYIVKIKLNLQAKLRVDLISKYHLLDHRLFLNRESSDYIQNITSGVSIFSNVLMSLLRIISECIIIIVIFFYLIFLNTQIVVFVMVALTSIVLINRYFFRNSLVNIGSTINKESKGIIQIIADFIKGIKEIKISQKENFFLSMFKKKAKNLAVDSLTYEIILFIPRHFFELLLVICVISFIFFNLNSLSSGNSLQHTGVLATYFYVAIRLFPSFSIISRMLSTLDNGLIYTENLYKDLNKTNQNKFSKIIEEKKSIGWDFKKLEFKNVSFAYSVNKFIFSELNLLINSSDSILITGPSGCGKSTIVDLILGFFKPTSGKILVNDNENDIENFKNNSYYISQNKFLFNDTIFNNIVVDKNKSNYQDLNNDEKLLFDDALKISRLQEVVNNKSAGLDFFIGEGGSNLSGGQRQRISIARSLFSGRKIIILDEATSELDKKLEKEIFFDIINLTKNKKTIIVISHSDSIEDLFKYQYLFKGGKLTKLQTLKK